MKATVLANHLKASELQERVRKTNDASMRDKYRALLWVLQGEPCSKIAELLGVDRSTICEWVNRYNSEGEAGLRRKPGQGRKRRSVSGAVSQS